MSNELKNLCNSLQFDINGNVAMRTVSVISDEQFAQLHSDLLIIARLLANQSRAFIFTQSLLANEWVINHNLGYMPMVATYDTNGVEILGAVTNIDLNNTIIHFSSPLSGTARLL